MTSGYYCAIFPFCGGGKKKKKKKEKDDQKTKAFYDWATTGIRVKIEQFYSPRTNFTKSAHRDFIWVKSSLVLTCARLHAVFRGCTNPYFKELIGEQENFRSHTMIKCDDHN